MTEQQSTGASTVETQFGKEIGKKIEALAPGEPFMVARHIPRCPVCGAANPTALSACPACSEPAPPTTLYYEGAVRTGASGFLNHLCRIFRFGSPR